MVSAFLFSATPERKFTLSAPEASSTAFQSAWRLRLFLSYKSAWGYTVSPNPLHTIFTSLKSGIACSSIRFDTNFSDCSDSKNICVKSTIPFVDNPECNKITSFSPVQLAKARDAICNALRVSISSVFGTHCVNKALIWEHCSAIICSFFVCEIPFFLSGIFNCSTIYGFPSIWIIVIVPHTLHTSLILSSIAETFIDASFFVLPTRTTKFFSVTELPWPHPVNKITAI